MGVWIPFNPNPAFRNVGDCAVRAVCSALGVPWDTAYAMIAAKGFEMADMPSSNAVWGAVLRDHGFRRTAIPSTCTDCYTAGDFCLDYASGVYVLGFGTHVATARDGFLFDSWDSTHEIPQYYWSKEAEHGDLQQRLPDGISSDGVSPAVPATDSATGPE